MPSHLTYSFQKQEHPAGQSQGYHHLLREHAEGPGGPPGAEAEHIGRPSSYTYPLILAWPVPVTGDEIHGGRL